ncbi:MAG: SDR family NAD(P)-dependent oxidoreductase [Dehalococcoidales bacterium]
MRLEGKVAVITGAGSGIGRATAKLFAKEGAKILVADFNSKLGQETVEEIKKAGGTANFSEVNVGRIADNERMIDTAVNIYQRLDILYNNAGIGGPTLEATTEENWQTMLDVNLTGPFFASKRAIEVMKKQGIGNILFTGSAGGLKGTSRARSPSYSAVKGGVILLADCLSRLVGQYNIRVNTICPGVTNTALYDSHFYDAQGNAKTLNEEEKRAFMAGFNKQISLGRVGTPEEIANLALFLASDESSHITGEAILIDGGRQ